MIKKDITERSMKMLEQRASTFLGRGIWAPDWKNPFVENHIHPDVVLMGSYFEMIFQEQFWPLESFALFCLSPQIKRILADVFHFDSEKIAVLPRYSLFPKAVVAKPFEFESDTAFYYGGRLSPQKNIEFLICTVFYLQLLKSSDIKLILMGHFDNEYHKDLLGVHFIDYRKKLNDLISGLPWPGQKPEIIEGKNESEWLECLPEKGIHISASTHICEDFSVSAAQLQSLGQPQLLPLWGGLGDARDDNILHYSSELIADSHSTLSDLNKKAKVFALKIIDGDLLKLPFHETEFHRPVQKCDRTYLKALLDLNRKIQGEAIDLLVKGQLPEFVKTEAGQLVFKKCRQILGSDIACVKTQK